MSTRDVEIGIIGRDKTEKATRSASRNFQGLQKDVRKVNDELGNNRGLKRFTSAVSAMTKKVTGKVSGIFDGMDMKAKAMMGLSLKGMLAAAVAGAPALGAAVVAGMALGAGAGILAIGAIALKENKKVKDAFARTGSTIQKVLTKAAQPLVGPFVRGLAIIERTVKGLAPDFRAIFRAIAPVVPLLSKAFGGVLGEVVKALRDSMPGITAAFRGLASALPTVGKWLGQFVRTLFSNPKVIEKTTRALTLLAAGPLKLLGPLLSGLNVLFGAQVNAFRLLQLTGGTLFSKLVAWFDNGSGAVSRLKAAFGPLWQAIQNVWNKLKEFAAAKTDAEIVAKFKALVEAIKKTWKPLQNFINTVWSEIWAFVKRVWNEQVVPWWNGTAKPWLKKALSGAMDEAGEMMKQKAIAKMKQLPGAIIGALAGLPGRLVAALGGGMAAAGASIGRRLIDGIVGAIRGHLGDVRSAGQAAANVAAAAAASFSGTSSWSPAQTAAQFASGGGTFAMAGGGTSRTGGPVEVNQTLNVSLDGDPFYSYVDRAIAGNNRRQAWLDRNRRR